MIRLDLASIDWAGQDWLVPLGIFLGVELVLRWSDLTNDRTARAMLFDERPDRFLAAVCVALKITVVAVPLAVWGLAGS